MERELDYFVELISERPMVVLFVGMIFIGIVMLMISAFLKMISVGKKSKDSLNLKKEVVNSRELEDLEKDIFQLYKEVEIAKMKFRFPVLKEKLGDSIYSKLEDELKKLKKNQQKMVSTNIQLEEIKILSQYQRNGVLKIEVFLHVSQYDYVVNQEKVVVRGTDEDRYQIEYKMVVDCDLKTQQYRIFKRECVGKWISK